MEPEENNTNQQRPLVPKTIRVQAEDNDQWKLIKDNLVQANNRTISDTEVFSEVITRYFLPINQNKETAQQLADRDSKIAALQQELEETKAQLAEAKSRANANAEAANQQQLDYEARLKDLQQQCDVKVKEAVLLIVRHEKLHDVAVIELNYSQEHKFGEIKTAEPRRNSAVKKLALKWEGAKHSSGSNGNRLN